MHGLVRAAVATALLVTAGCSAGEVTVPKADAPTVSSLLTQLEAGQSAGSASLASSGTSTAPVAPATNQDPNACVYDATDKRFNCPRRTMPNGMTMDMYFQLLDGAGAPQAAFDTATTAAIRRVSDRAGTLNQPLMTQNGPVPAVQTITEHLDMTLSGIRTGNPVHNGTGTMTNALVPTGLPSANITATQTFTGIVIDPAPSAPKYPKAGSIGATVVSTTGSQPQVTTTQVTTYDGTKVAKTVITLPNGGTRTCTYDMTSQAPPVCTGP
jgi:hypothetical protein